MGSSCSHHELLKELKNSALLILRSVRLGSLPLKTRMSAVDRQKDRCSIRGGYKA